MNTSTGGFYKGNEAEGKAKGGVRRVQNVMPVVIRQLLADDGEEFKIFGFSTQILSIVGILREYEVQSTKAVYQVEDHTGKINVVWWLENDNNLEPKLPEVREGRYCKVFGSLRTHDDGSKMIFCIRLFQIDHMNEVTNHLLQVIHARLEAEAFTKNSMVRIKTNNPGASLVNSMSFMDTTMSAVVDSTDGLTPVQEKVLNVLRPVKLQNGLSIQAILQHFPPNQHKEVRLAVNFLITEGHIFSTADEDHYRLTDF